MFNSLHKCNGSFHKIEFELEGKLYLVVSCISLHFFDENWTKILDFVNWFIFSEGD